MNDITNPDQIDEALNDDAPQPRRTARGRAPANRAEAARNTPRQDRTPERTEEREPDRIPAYARQSIDTHRVTPGFHGHWFSTDPGRIDMALAAGYRFKTKDGHTYSATIHENGIDSRVSKPGGGGITLYFMEIPLDLYEADQRAKHAIAGEQLGSVLPQDPGFYSRDAQGRMTDASQAAWVETKNTAT